MTTHKKLTFGMLSVLLLAIVPVVSSQVQADDTNEKQVIAVATKGELLKYGEFKSVEKRVSGDVRLIQADNGRIYLDFDQNFRTEDGPDLFVVLSRSANLEESGASDDEIYYKISPVLKLRGEQRYILPGDFDPNEYQAVGIWCRQMNVLFGAATLKNK